MESKVSRRQFLRLAGGAAGAIALTACAAPTAPAGGGETAMSQKKIVIRYAGLDGMGARVETYMLPVGGGERLRTGTGRVRSAGTD